MSPTHGHTETETAQALSEVAQLRKQVRRLRNYVIELEQKADTDMLLSVYNRRAFVKELSRAQSVLERYQIPCVLIYFGLDDITAISDQYGQTISNDILHKVEAVLLSRTRGCDMVARLSDTEFGVLMFKADYNLASAKAQALACRIADIQINLPTSIVTAKASWGIAECRVSETAEAMMARAHDDMFLARTAKEARLS